MVCPYCGNSTSVINSRHQRRLNQVWRRRQCVACQNVFTTIEAAELSVIFMIETNKQLQPFQREKLLVSIYECCRHRQDAINAAPALTATVISKLPKKLDQATILREDLINTTLNVLKNFDHAAYVQYQAYHPLTYS